MRKHTVGYCLFWNAVSAELLKRFKARPRKLQGDFPIFSYRNKVANRYWDLVRRGL